MSCRCSDIRDCERDLRVLQRALRDNGQLGQRIRTLAASGHEGYQRYLENCIWAAEDDLAAMQEEDDAYHEDDDD